MGYNTSIPNTGQSLAFTRDPIRNNFQLIKNLINVNHGDFGSSIEGKHKFVQFPEITQGPSTLVNEGALYTKVSGGITRLFWRPENQLVGGSEFELTNIDPFLDLGAREGYTYLANGLLLIFGTKVITCDGTGDATITFPNSLTLNNLPLSITASCSNSVLAVQTRNSSFTGFDVRIANNLNTTLRYMAIGTR